MSDTAEQLRVELAATRPAHNSAGYPPELRDRAGAWLADRHAEGAGWKALGARLGICRTTARAWARCASRGAAAEVTFLPVAPRPASSLASSRRPGLVSPRGYRVEGLDSELLVDLLERLG